MSDAMTVFARHTVRQRRERAARHFADHDFLAREVGERLVDRLDDVRRPFPRVLELGSRRGLLRRLAEGRAGGDVWVESDLSPAMLASGASLRVVADEEALPFRGASFDLAISALCLHWVNDVPGTLVQLRHALKPDGLLLGALLGGQTLRELREVLGEAELDLEGGVSPRVSPFADVRDIGNLLQRAGFALPIADLDSLTVRYESPWRLLADLRGMGETNASVHRRRRFTRRSTLFAAMERYQARFGDAEGRVPATFQVIFFSGWAPDPSQPRAARRGSGQVPLADALRTPGPPAAGEDGQG